MGRLPFLVLGTLAFLTVVQPAAAQGVGRSGRDAHRATLGRPVVSPYLNLLRRDLDPAENYYTLVRPPLQQRATNLMQSRALQEQQQEIQQLRSDLASGPYGPAQGIRPTGRSATYLNYSHYYPGFSARQSLRPRR